jgi:hypothetical protein
MRFVKKILRLIPTLVLVVLLFPAKAQINSPFSRYGLGNEVYNSQNASSQALGGLTAAYTSSMNGTFGQSLNFNNPASYGSIYMTTFDIGMNLTTNSLRRQTPVAEFNSNYFVPNYLAVGLPIDKTKRMGMAFGLRPLTQINYSVVELKPLPSGDSVVNNYIGQGGLNQAFIGFGKSWKKFSVGLNTGYNFGKKRIENIKSFIFNSDSTSFYQSQSSTNTLIGGVFLQLGIAGDITLKTVAHKLPTDKTEYTLSYGATASLNQTLSGKQDILRSTGSFTIGTEAPLDTVSLSVNNPGKIKIPGMYTAGITLHKKQVSNSGVYDQWVIGLQYDRSNWQNNYSFYGQRDQLSDAYMARIGVQFCPNPLDYENYWSTVTYRAGFNTGKDYINIDQNGLKVSAFTFGAGLPIRKYRSYDYQFSLLNLAFQFGKRGSNLNSYQENFFQFTFGYSLSDIWFNKRKYD